MSIRVRRRGVACQGGEGLAGAGAPPFPSDSASKAKWQMTGRKARFLFVGGALQEQALDGPAAKQKSRTGRAAHLPFALHSAESEGFEPPERCRSTVFKTAAIDHSASSPKSWAAKLNNLDKIAKL